MDMDPKTNPYVREHERTREQLEDLRKACHKVIKICLPLAANRNFMQIAGPARQIVNILTPYQSDE